MKQNPLPSIGDLFKESWEAFKKSVFYLIAFYILAFIAGLVVYGVFFLIFMLLGAGSLAALPELQKGGAGLIGVIGTFSVLLPVFIIVAIILGSAIQAGMILIANKYKNEISFGEVLKQSLHLAIPLFLVNLLFAIITFGGFFVFIIPAFAFALLFSFASYEVVLGSQRWINALRSSMNVVLPNLGEILVRLLLIWAIMIGFSILRSMIEIPLVLLAGGNGTILSIILSFLFLPIQIALSIFSIYYMMVLYNQAKAVADPNKKSSLKWVWVITGIGWVIGVAVLISVMALIMNLSKSGQFEKIMKSLNKGEINKAEKVQNFRSTNKSIQSGQLKLSTALQLSKKTTLTREDKNQITGLLSGAVSDFKQATDEDPENYEAWYYRGKAYNHLIGIIDKADDFAISSLNKAIELNPDCYDCFIELGHVYIFIKDYEDAIRKYQEATKLNPKSANAFFNLGIAYKRFGVNTEAKKSLEKASKLLPENDPTRYLLEKELQGL